MEATAENDAEPISEVVYVWFNGPIQEGPAEALVQILTECANSGVREVHLLLSTFGGNPSVGISLYNTLRGFPFKLVTHNSGNVDSIGVAVYLAGDERRTCPISQFMLHGVTVSPQGQLDARTLTEERERAEREGERTNDVLRARTEMSEDEIREYAQTEHTADAASAVKVGIAQKIEDIDIPEDAFLITVPIPR